MGKRLHGLNLAISILSAIVVILALAQLTGIWDKAAYVFEPLLGVVLLLQAVQNWNKNRAVAVLSLCAALFMWSAALVVFFL